MLYIHVLCYRLIRNLPPASKLVGPLHSWPTSKQAAPVVTHSHMHVSTLSRPHIKMSSGFHNHVPAKLLDNRKHRTSGVIHTAFVFGTKAWIPADSFTF